MFLCTHCVYSLLTLFTAGVLNLLQKLQESLLKTLRTYYYEHVHIPLNHFQQFFICRVLQRIKLTLGARNPHINRDRIILFCSDIVRRMMPDDKYASLYWRTPPHGSTRVK
jgi:hypothetical protein